MTKARPARGPGPFLVRTSRRGSDLDVELGGELCAGSAHHLEETMFDLVGSGDRVVVDFTGLSSIDATGLDALARSSAEAFVRGARVFLRSHHGGALLALEHSPGSAFEFAQLLGERLRPSERGDH